MTDEEYRQKLSACKTQQERYALNDEYLKCHVRNNKKNKIKKYFKNNYLSLIAIVLAVLDSIVAIIALLK